MVTSGLQMNSEACHKNQLWQGEMTVNGTILTMGVLPLDKVYVQLSPEKKILESLLSGTILNKVESSGPLS